MKAVAGAALAITALAGCSSGAPSWSQDQEGGYSGSDAGYAAPEQAVADSAAAPIPADPSIPGGPSATAEQAIIVTGDASVKVDSPADALAAFTATVEHLGGLISTSELSQSGSTPSGSVTARVPADKYQELVDSLADLGEVLRSSTSSEDVGQTLADIDARISALEISIERLTTLMGEATTTADLLEAEQMLTYRQAELDSLRAQGDYLRDQVAMSTLSVYFTTTSSQPAPQGSLAEGWEMFQRSMISLFYTVMWLLPWIILGALILTPLLLWRRNSRRRRSERFAGAVGAAGGAVPMGSAPLVRDGEASVPSEAPPAVVGSASDGLVHDAAERDRIVGETPEEEAVDGATEPGEEPGSR